MGPAADNGGLSMDAETTVMSVVTPVVPECEADRYTGSADTYCVFTLTEMGTLFADGKPGVVVYVVNIDLYLPVSADPRSIKRRLRDAIAAAPHFTFPIITPVPDDIGRHYNFECRYWDSGRGD